MSGSRPTQLSSPSSFTTRDSPVFFRTPRAPGRSPGHGSSFTARDNFRPSQFFFRIPFRLFLFGTPFANPSASPLRIPNRIPGVSVAAGGQKESEKRTGRGQAKGVRKTNWEGVSARPDPSCFTARDSLSFFSRRPAPAEPFPGSPPVFLLETSMGLSSFYYRRHLASFFSRRQHVFVF